MGTKVVYLARGKEKTTDPVLPQAGHLSGHHFALSQVLLWLPWACQIKSGPSGQSWSPLSLQSRFKLLTFRVGSLTVGFEVAPPASIRQMPVAPSLVMTKNICRCCQASAFDPWPCHRTRVNGLVISQHVHLCRIPCCPSGKLPNPAVELSAAGAVNAMSTGCGLFTSAVHSKCSVSIGHKIRCIFNSLF